MTSGWIKLHRQFLDWGWYQDANTCRLFLHLLLTANREPGEWKGVRVQRGQLVTGRTALAKSTGLTEQNVRTALSNLKSTSEVTIKSTSRFSVITINNYEKYQSTESANQQKSQPANQQLTSNQPASNHKQEGKKEEKKEDDNVVVAAKPADAERTLDDEIAKHLKTLGIRSPKAYLLKIKMVTGNNSAAIRKAWREWKSGGISTVGQFYDRCLFHAAK